MNHRISDSWLISFYTINKPASLRASKAGEARKSSSFIAAFSVSSSAKVSRVTACAVLGFKLGNVLCRNCARLLEQSHASVSVLLLMTRRVATDFLPLRLRSVCSISVVPPSQTIFCRGEMLRFSRESITRSM